jgi:hypothetical protein
VLLTAESLKHVEMTIIFAVVQCDDCPARRSASFGARHIDRRSVTAWRAVPR